MSIEVADSLNVSRTDTVLDIRSRIETEADIYNIKYPARGGLVYCIENGKYYSIKTLAAAEVNGYTIANYKVGTYEEFSGSSGGGSYSAGEGISISGGTIAVNWAVVAKASDIVEYKSGTGISIVNGVINCTVTPEDPIEYTAGDGITVSTDNKISIKGVPVKIELEDGFGGLYIDAEGNLKFVGTVYALKTDLTEYRYTAGEGIAISEDNVISCTVTPEDPIEYSAGEGLSLSGTTFSVDFSTVARKGDIPDGTTDYNALDNKPIITAGEGVTVELIKGGALIVSGAGDADTNGTYEMVDQSAEGTARVWQKEGRKLYNDGEKWIFDDDTDASSFYYSSTGTADPWGATFTASLSSLGNAPTVALVDNGMQDKIIIDIGDTIGNINSILDAINGEVI